MDCRGSVSAVPLAALSLLCVLLFGAASALDAAPGSYPPLRVGFYEETCPRAEEIVHVHVVVDPLVAGGLLRLHFHDCFVRGCDASILLDATPTGQPVEKDSPANGATLRGLDVIDRAKAELENVCPGTVSCADILALAARDAAVVSGMPGYPVPTGRRDGLASVAAEVIENLPPPMASAALLTAIFARKGFTQEEMVVLSGAHSIGSAHCSSFDYRLYDFQPGQPQDPTVDPPFADLLKLLCPAQGSTLRALLGDRLVLLDHITPLTLDHLYYVNLLKGKGLLASDQALMGDPMTSGLVTRWASQPAEWRVAFQQAMVKVGALDVLTGNQGEVRLSCRHVN